MRKKALGCLTYAAIGFLLLFPLGMFFDDMKWPLLTLFVFAADHFPRVGNSD
jgi:hypothetical protein